MLHKILNSVAKSEAKAHCDVPCGIYDPSTALIPALTVVRMMDIMNELDASGADKDAEYFNKMSRCIAEKERHATHCKSEVNVIWGDYFKAAQFEKFPQASSLVHGIMMQGSKCKTSVSRDEALKLVEMVNEFAEIFWATKGTATKRATCPYAPALEVVYPDI